MSRTYRKPLVVVSQVWRDNVYGDRGDWDLTRDRKAWGKPPRWFKKMYRAMRRAKVRDALRNGRLPEREVNENAWNWN